MVYHLLKFKYHTQFSANELITHFPGTTFYQKQDRETMNKLYIQSSGQWLGEKWQDHAIKGFKDLKKMYRARYEDNTWFYLCVRLALLPYSWTRYFRVEFYFSPLWQPPQLFLVFFYNSHANKCEVISFCNFDLHLPDV